MAERFVISALWLAIAVPAVPAVSAGEKNLLEDPSFEATKEPDQFGLVFAKWGGWKYEGECEFRVGRVARTGKTSCLLSGGSAPKIRIRQESEVPPGRYRMTAYLRGLEIGAGTWNMTTEFAFDGKYFQLGKNGTFGWTKVTHVAEVKEKKKAAVSFGLMAPGFLWIDDAAMERVGDEVPLTEKPVLGPEEAPIAPPGDLGPDPVRCSDCGCRSRAEWKSCYACGGTLEAARAQPAGPPERALATFEEANPFKGGTVVEAHATEGKKSLRIDRSYVSMDGRQDWRGYDYLMADLFTEAKDPIELYVEIRDRGTRDYWTRVNWTTVVPPGRSRLVLPLGGLYVGEKSRPGRMLFLDGIDRLVLSIGDRPPAPIFVDRIRLERDRSTPAVLFDGLQAFDLGTATSPVLEGFARISPATIYSPARGYGLRDARIWRTFDALQPDPLYQDFICIESGGLSVDVRPGRYRVFVNLDNPSGYWGEFQAWRERTVLAEGKPVVAETMDFEALERRYFRFWDVEDSAGEDAFDKYQKAYYREKTFDVDVDDGRLDLEFRGANWACSVAAVVIFPIEKAAEGERFLRHVEERRRFHFGNAFKRVIRRPTGDPLRPAEEDRRRGFLLFSRDPMEDVFDGDTPFAAEVGRPLGADGFAGELEPFTLGIIPLRDLGTATVTPGDLAGPGGAIPASAIEVGPVSYRLSRVTMEGSVYTIAPRLILPAVSAELKAGIARRFWLTVKIPADRAPGTYRGIVTVRTSGGGAAEVPVEVRVRPGALDPADIPIGPWGHEIRTPWYGTDPAATAFGDAVTAAGLRRLREYGFTAFSGIPTVEYRGFRDGMPVLDFSRADRDMRTAKELGFLAVVAYGSGVRGFTAYFRDDAKMKEAGFDDYPAFLGAVHGAVADHARREGWIPVYWNLADEPLGDDLTRSAENAEAYRKAFPEGPPFFTGASSFTGDDAKDPHFRLSRALHVANWNLHDEASVNLLRGEGGRWAFYNGGNRWTLGIYLFKATKEYGLTFRLSWHWNSSAGDPYYALDCREDDYAWCNATPDGRLVPSVEFERLREGLDDYRRLLTLSRLIREKAGSPEADRAAGWMRRRLGSFRLGEREPPFGPEGWTKFRTEVGDAIEELRR